MWEIRFSVRGRGPFPWDMLRYDRATPYLQDDVNRATEADYRLERTVNLVAFYKDKARRPTRARWESFQWRIIEQHSPVKVR